MHPPSNTASVPLATTDQEETARLWSLILCASEIPHQLDFHSPLWTLLVPMEHRLRAAYELEAYSSENREWPPHSLTVKDDFTPLLQPPTLLLIGALVLFYTITGPWEQGSHWFTQGCIQSEQILSHGQWWRLFTALTLHADAVHLLSNCIIGGWLIHFLCRLTGSGLGLFSLLTSAGLGNFINTACHDPSHQSVGFSTAVFAVIGILSSLSFLRQKHTIGSRLLVPLMAGAALLAALGSSGERTDLGAHLFGLLSGLLAGQILGREPLLHLRHSLLFQTMLFSVFLVLPPLSWMLALNADTLTALQTSTFGILNLLY